MLFPLAKEVQEALDFEAHGAEFIDLPVMAINLPGPGGKALLFYRKPLRSSRICSSSTARAR